jgi:hypothetical protein
MNHLFFGCPLARYVWNMVGVALNLDAMPCSFSEGNVFPLFSGIDRKVVMIGGCCSMLDTLEDME